MAPISQRSQLEDRLPPGRGRQGTCLSELRFARLEAWQPSQARCLISEAGRVARTRSLFVVNLYQTDTGLVVLAGDDCGVRTRRKTDCDRGFEVVKRRESVAGYQSGLAWSS